VQGWTPAWGHRPHTPSCPGQDDYGYMSIANERFDGQSPFETFTKIEAPVLSALQMAQFI